MPTYNCAQYIQRAIDSVLNQTYQNKELIVIDGDSNDNTIKILKSYGSKIKWVSEKDNGQADAINKGFKMATGDIVAWLNADDYYEPNILSKISEEFMKNKESISMIYGKCNSVRGTETIINTPPNKISAKDLILSGNLIYQPSSFYDLELVKKVGYLDDNLEYWMEYDLYIKLLKEKPSKYIDVILSNFTVREDQKSNLKNTKKMNEELIKINKKHGGGKIFSKFFLKKILNKFR